mmetsp:Transcript_5215/g.9329  ORF Transcript_5215/g.9329 Transcript_5215/m.9329 type:complete len:170 (-) Transcript_5215:122-631(-)
MGGCFAKALLSEDEKSARRTVEEMEFRRHESSLARSSDASGSDYNAANLTVINTVNLRRRDSEIIRTAKENLRKFPRKSSMKNKDVDSVLSSDRSSLSSDSDSRALMKSMKSSLDSDRSGGSDLAPTSSRTQFSEGTNTNGSQTDRPKSDQFNRSVSFCQEVILIQYHR